ncbi:MAG: carboxypeptidase-like regulatory domain-containing protein [Gemmatimonas sp.]
MIKPCVVALLIAASANVAVAQNATSTITADPTQSGVVRGTVTARLTGEALSHAVITIDALEMQLFSSEQGRFYFVKVKPGKYLLNVRQLGYLPVNVDIVVEGTGATEVKIQMDRIATKLATFKVTDKQAVCETPGRPTVGDGEQLAEVFEQLEQSAIRLALFAKQYPYRMLLDRRFLTRDVDGKDVAGRADILVKEGQLTATYQPGRIVARVVGSGGDYSFQIPSLLDFADKKFLANHCFTLRGLESMIAEDGPNSPAYIRVDFTAWSKLSDPDVEGSVFLDSADYRLRRAELRLTKVPNNLRQVADVHVTTRFQDANPGMPVIALVEAVTDLKPEGKKPFRIARRTEQQVVATLVYLKQHPDSAPRAKK